MLLIENISNLKSITGGCCEAGCDALAKIPDYLKNGILFIYCG